MSSVHASTWTAKLTECNKWSPNHSEEPRFFRTYKRSHKKSHRATKYYTKAHLLLLIPPPDGNSTPNPDQSQEYHKGRQDKRP